MAGTWDHLVAPNSRWRRAGSVTGCDRAWRAEGPMRGSGAGGRLHLAEPRVVVRELAEVRERNLAGQDRVVAGHVGLGIAAAVLQLDVQALTGTPRA